MTRSREYAAPSPIPKALIRLNGQTAAYNLPSGVPSK